MMSISGASALDRPTAMPFSTLSIDTVRQSLAKLSNYPHLSAIRRCIVLSMGLFLGSFRRGAAERFFDSADAAFANTCSDRFAG